MYTDSIVFFQKYGEPLVTEDVNYEIHDDNDDLKIVVNNNNNIQPMVLRKHDCDSIIYINGEPVEACEELDVGLENHRDFLCIKRHLEMMNIKQFYWSFNQRSVTDFHLNRVKFFPHYQMKNKLNTCLQNLGIGRVVMDPEGNCNFESENESYILVQDKDFVVRSDKNLLNFFNCAHEFIDNYFVKWHQVKPKKVSIYDENESCIDKFKTRFVFCLSLDTARQILDNLNDIVFYFQSDNR